MNREAQFILASGSPRRAELLQAAGYAFEVAAADIDESDYPPTASPGEIVELLARKKAEASALRFPGRVILAADTLVVCDGQVIGKPMDRAHAMAIIRKLSGRTHEVISGVAVLSRIGDIEVQAVVSIVRMSLMEEEAIKDYARTDRWRGKAGAYGVQDESPIAEVIDGSRTNVMGLPMTITRTMLDRAGVKPRIE